MVATETRKEVPSMFGGILNIRFFVPGMSFRQTRNNISNFFFSPCFSVLPWHFASSGVVGFTHNYILTLRIDNTNFGYEPYTKEEVANRLNRLKK